MDYHCDSLPVVDYATRLTPDDVVSCGRTTTFATFDMSARTNHVCDKIKIIGYFDNNFWLLF